MKQALIVDDSAVIRQISAHILERLDFCCVEVEDLATALAQIEKNPPDLILLGGGGRSADTVDFLRRLRRSPGGERPRVILCPIENDELVIGRALRAGANEVMFKPFDMAMLQERLRDLDLFWDGAPH